MRQYKCRVQDQVTQLKSRVLEKCGSRGGVLMSLSRKKLAHHHLHLRDLEDLKDALERLSFELDRVQSPLNDAAKYARN